MTPEEFADLFFAVVKPQKEKQRKQLGYPERLHPSGNRQTLRLINATELFLSKSPYPGTPIMLWANWKDPKTEEIMTGLVSELSEREEQWR